MSTPPIIIASIGERGTLHFWCDHCQLWHHHGAGEGHRIAHCLSTDSPYKTSGYYLRPGAYPYTKGQTRRVKA